MSGQRGLLRVNFDEEIKNYDTKDGIIAIIFYFYNMLIIYLFGLLLFKTNIYGDFSKLFINNGQLYEFIFYIPIVILQVLPIFILIKIRKQSIKSIGLKNYKIVKSIILGIIFSLPLIFPSVLQGRGIKESMMNFNNLIWLFLYFLIEIAFVEEVCFRGYIQTRIQGLIKSKWVSIIVVGIMFGLMHVPFQMIRAGMPLVTFVIKDSIHLITTCVIHIYLVYLFTRDNNIASTTVAHALIDFIPSIIQ